MLALEQLRPFVSLFQACGFIPFTMEYDSNTKQLIKFRFSWRNLTTWWFIIISVLQLGLRVITSQNVGNIVWKIKKDEQPPITITISIAVTALCALVQFILSRTIVFRHYRRLQNAIKLAILVEKSLQRITQSSYRTSFKRRFLIGFFLLATSVGAQFHFYSSYPASTNFFFE